MAEPTNVNGPPAGPMDQWLDPGIQQADAAEDPLQHLQVSGLHRQNSVAGPQKQGRPQPLAGCVIAQAPKSLGPQILVEFYIYISNKRYYFP
jgi:hypothetical protein